MHDDHSDEGLATSLLTCVAALTTVAVVCIAPFYYATSGTVHENVGLAAYRPPARASVIPTAKNSGVALVRLQSARADPVAEAFAAKVNQRARIQRRQQAHAAEARSRRAAQIRRTTEQAEQPRHPRGRSWAMQPRGPMYQPPIF